MSRKNGTAEIKFHFIDDSYVIRKFNFNNRVGGLMYTPTDYGRAAHEISYHSANTSHSTPVLLSKYKDRRARVPISDEIANLALEDMIVPIPICRITANIASERKYHSKDQHCTIQLSNRYNTADIYIAKKDYDPDRMRREYPMIVDLFQMTTVDFLLYGSGIAAEPIFNKMFESDKPILALEGLNLGDYRFFWRTYKLLKDDAFRMYSDPEYSQNNFIEFFNNIDYLDLLATTDISYRLKESRCTPPKPAYKYDLQNLERIGSRRESIRKLEKRFSEKRKCFEDLNKLRSGIVFG